MLRRALRTLISMEGKLWAETVFAKNAVAAIAEEIVLNVFMVEAWVEKVDYGGWSTRGLVGILRELEVALRPQTCNVN